MSTSGIVTYTINRDQLITAALIECGVIDPENITTPTATAISNASTALNMMLRTWMANGLQLWEKRYAAIFLQKNQSVYVLGNSAGAGGDNACVSTPLTQGFVQTTVGGLSGLNLTLLSTSTQLNTIGSPSTTIGTGWNIGLQQFDGTMFWTTSTGPATGQVVPITATPTVGTYAGAFCVAYQTKLFKPLRIMDGFVRQTSSQNDVPVRVISREEYNRYGNKASNGTSIQIMYDSQLYSGNLYLYPTPQDVTQILYLEIQKPLDAMTSATDNYDLPEEWVEALKYNLALRLTTPYGVPKQKRDEIKENASISYSILDAWDQEEASFNISPDNWTYNYGTSR